MNHCTEPHCAFCLYQHAAGTLTTTTPSRTRHDPACWTCAREALAYYASLPTRATFIAWPTR